MDQARIDLFAEASGDHQWIHVDPVRAAGSRIRLRAAVADVTETRGGAEIVLALTLEVEEATKPACVAEAVYRYID